VPTQNPAPSAKKMASAPAPAAAPVHIGAAPGARPPAPAREPHGAPAHALSVQGTTWSTPGPGGADAAPWTAPAFQGGDEPAPALFAPGGAHRRRYTQCTAAFRDPTAAARLWIGPPNRQVFAPAPPGASERDMVNAPPPSLLRLAGQRMEQP
jgi:hypothetical protein